MFNHEDIPNLFEGIRTGKAVVGSKYIVSSSKGDIAEINNLGSNEWRIFIDNFPGRKLFFQYNFPINTKEQFMADMERIGISLKLKQ